MSTAISTLCRCCDEREAHPLCDGLCEECARPNLCSREGCMSEIDADDWQPGDEYGDRLCESCQAREEKWAWMNKTEERVLADAKKHGWDKEKTSQAQTGTVYVTLWRASPMDEEEEAADPDEEEWTDGENLIVRIGDHGSCYCSEDISLVMPGHESGDDHTYTWFLSRLQTKPGHLND